MNSRIGRPLFVGHARAGTVGADEAVRAAADEIRRALATGADPRAACGRLGSRSAEQGAALRETLRTLAGLYAAAGRPGPPYDALETAAVAWAEESLQFLRSLSCEDPLTGLATLTHVRTRLGELYRAADGFGRPLTARRVLLVVEVRDDGADPWDRAFRLADVGRCLRAVLPGDHTVGRTGPARVVAVVDRASNLPLATASLDRLLGGAARIRVETLPVGPDQLAL
jgi:hypothetical protein